MAFASISHGHRTPFVFIDDHLKAQRYVNIILRLVIVQFVRRRNLFCYVTTR